VKNYSKTNYIDHRLINQTSILRFIEDNWIGGQRIGDHSFDAKAGSIAGMFDFNTGHKSISSLFLDSSTGMPT
jgi:phospholipase C